MGSPRGHGDRRDARPEVDREKRRPHLAWLVAAVLRVAEAEPPSGVRAPALDGVVIEKRARVHVPHGDLERRAPWAEIDGGEHPPHGVGVVAMVAQIPEPEQARKMGIIEIPGRVVTPTFDGAVLEDRASTPAPRRQGERASSARGGRRDVKGRLDASPVHGSLHSSARSGQRDEGARRRGAAAADAAHEGERRHDEALAGAPRLGREEGPGEQPGPVEGHRRQRSAGATVRGGPTGGVPLTEGLAALGADLRRAARLDDALEDRVVELGGLRSPAPNVARSLEGAMRGARRSAGGRAGGAEK